MPSAATHAVTADTSAADGAERKLSAATQRIDQPHRSRQLGRPSADGPPPLVPLAEVTAPGAQAWTCDESAASDTFVQDEELLRLHATDLIAELRHWIEEIDARESQLNARTALQDLRERQFRAWENSQRRQLEDAHRVAHRQQEELKDALRRAVIAVSATR